MSVIKMETELDSFAENNDDDLEDDWNDEDITDLDDNPIKEDEEDNY